MACGRNRHAWIPLIHISTDYVFDGQRCTLCRKGCPRHSMPMAAASLPANAGVRRQSRHVILRTSWVYSPYRKNFVRTILRLARERERLTVVTDQRGCPTRRVILPRLASISRCAARPSRPENYGTYHFAGAGEATWFEFANAIVETAAGRLSRLPEVVPIPSAQYPSPAPRPANSRLDCSAIRMLSDLQPDHGVALGETIDCLLASRRVT